MCASMSFATAGMTRSAVSTYAPPMGKAFQNLGEQTETRANSLATLQQLAEARIDARPSSMATTSGMNMSFNGETTRSHWSNSGLVDLHSTRAHFDAPMKSPFATGERTVYVAATNIKSLKNKQKDAQSIVQSYVNSLAPEEVSDKLTASNAGKSVPVKAAREPVKTVKAVKAVKAVAAPVAKNDVSSAQTKALNDKLELMSHTNRALNEKLELMSKALTKLSEQQLESAKTLKATQTENKELQKGYSSLKASHSTLKVDSTDLNKTNVQLKKEIDILKKETQTSLGFARMAKKNKE